MSSKRNANSNRGLIHAVAKARHHPFSRRPWLYWPLAAFILLSAISQTVQSL